jgi:hypothetical protein
MTQMVLSASGMLTQMSPDEQILLRFNFYSLDLEQRTGLPKFMSVQGKRKDLLQAATGRMPESILSGILKVTVE